MNYNNPRRWHFVIFIVLSAVAIAQLSWWVVFQVQQGDRLIEAQMEIWNQQIAVAEMHLQRSEMEFSERERWLEEHLPDLEFTEDHDNIVVTVTAMAALENKAKKHVRMFVSEGAFFSLLVLAGIWFLYWALRERFQIEKRTAQILASAVDELNKPLESLSRMIAHSGVSDEPEKT